MRLSYPFKVRKEDGEFIVSFPDVPEALTGADSKEEAIDLAQDALIAALRGYIDDRRDIPVPSDSGKYFAVLSPLEAGKLALYIAMREEGVSNVALGKRLGIVEGAVRRMLDLDHGTKIETIYDALDRVFHYRLVTSMEKAA